MRYLFVLMLLLAGCATRQETAWFRSNTSEVEFQSDIGQCQAQGFSVPGAMTNLIQVAAVQSACMRGKGYYLKPVASGGDADGRAPAVESGEAFRECHSIAERVSGTRNSFDASYKAAYDGCMAKK